MAVVFLRGGLLFALVIWVGGLAGCASVPGGGPDEGAVRAPKDARADGYVVSVNKTAKEVYVNLTRSDHLRVGMKLESYDQRRGIIPGKREGAGVATLEVTQVGEDFSICRIARSSSRDIAAGDPIKGITFTKNYTYHFVISGDIDLDGDGVPTAAERERLETLIRAWGGVIDPVVNVHTDYLISGTRPQSSGMHDPEPVVVRGDVIDHRTQEQKAYDDVIAEARRYAVPVYNLNRALALIDYYDRALAAR